MPTAETDAEATGGTIATGGGKKPSAATSATGAATGQEATAGTEAGTAGMGPVS